MWHCFGRQGPEVQIFSPRPSSIGFNWFSNPRQDLFVAAVSSFQHTNDEGIGRRRPNRKFPSIQPQESVCYDFLIWILLSPPFSSPEQDWSPRTCRWRISIHIKKSYQMSILACAGTWSAILIRCQISHPSRTLSLRCAGLWALVGRNNYINRLLGDELHKKSRRVGCDRREKICHNFVTVRTLSNVMKRDQTWSNVINRYQKTSYVNVLFGVIL